MEKKDKPLLTLDFDPKHYPFLTIENKCHESWLCPWCLNKLNNFFDNCEIRDCHENKEKAGFKK